MKSLWSDDKVRQAGKSTFSTLIPEAEFLLKPRHASIFKVKTYGMGIFRIGL